MLLASDDEGPQERSSKAVSLHELLHRPCRCKRVVCLQQFRGFDEQVLEKRKRLQALSPHDRDALLTVRMFCSPLPCLTFRTRFALAQLRKAL